MWRRQNLDRDRTTDAAGALPELCCDPPGQLSLHRSCLTSKVERARRSRLAPVR